MLGAADRVVGGFTGAAQALLIVWLAGGLLAIGPVPRLTEAAQTLDGDPCPQCRPPATRPRSQSSSAAARRVGPAGRLRRLRAPPATAGRPADRRDRAAIAAVAEASTAEVSAATCGFDGLGTGFVVATTTS